MALEGFSSLPYKDIAGIWTNGFGNTENVGPHTPPVSVEQARVKLDEHVGRFGSAVLTALKTEPTQGQYDAYVLLAYNIGSQAFASSSTAKAHNRGDYYGACLYMMRWNKITKNGELVPSRGLTLRRYTEYNLCVAGIPDVGYVPRRR
jgi:lysozyme